MAKKRILRQVADAIETRSQGNMMFDMTTYGSPAWGSIAGCVAGFTVATIDGEDEYREMLSNSGNIRIRARNLLGLTDVQADNLFTPPGLTEITASQAIRTLRHLADTDQIDWKIGVDVRKEVSISIQRPVKVVLPESVTRVDNDFTYTVFSIDSSDENYVRVHARFEDLDDATSYVEQHAGHDESHTYVVFDPEWNSVETAVGELEENYTDWEVEVTNR